MYNSIARIFQLSIFLANAEVDVSREDICRHIPAYNGTRRMLERDLKTLEEAGFKVARTRHEQHVFFSLVATPFEVFHKGKS